MKTIAIFSLLSLLVFSACEKQIECFGTDCTFPEAAVAVDSITDKHIYVTLLNSDGEPFVYTPRLSPSIDEKEFIRYTGYHGSISNHSKSDGRILKVYYVAEDQSYVQNNATYINAFETSLEIVAFGDDLKLTY